MKVSVTTISVAELDVDLLLILRTREQADGAMSDLTSGFGGVLFGNEWGVETGGLTSFLGGGFEVQLSRPTVAGMSATYRPVLLFGWTDQAGQLRDTGVAHFWGIDVTIEARDALGSH